MTAGISFPRFAGKWRHRSLVEAGDLVRHYLPGVRTPRRCVLLWRPRVGARLARRFQGRGVAGISATYRLPGVRRSLGISVPRGVGAPTTVIRCEELAALGTKEFIGVGFAGSISPEVHVGDVVVCDGAARDEGISYHYAPAGVPAAPSTALNRWIQQTLRGAGLRFRVGPSWTTDAIYRETRTELRHYQRSGFLTVDMEASALFIFGRVRRLPTASVFVISDRLTEGKWKPEFHRVEPRLAEVAAAILRASLRS
ncbi:MAG: nucleoside phosphorylase [Thermoplasmata archaeon]